MSRRLWRGKVDPRLWMREMLNLLKTLLQYSVFTNSSVHQCLFHRFNLKKKQLEPLTLPMPRPPSTDRCQSQHSRRNPTSRHPDINDSLSLHTDKPTLQHSCTNLLDCKKIQSHSLFFLNRNHYKHCWKCYEKNVHFFLMCFYTRQAKAERYVLQLILTLPSHGHALHTFTQTHRHSTPVFPSSLRAVWTSAGRSRNHTGAVPHPKPIPLLSLDFEPRMTREWPKRMTSRNWL